MTRDPGFYREKCKKMPCSFYESSQVGSHQNRKSVLPVGGSIIFLFFWFPPNSAHDVLQITDLSGPLFTEDTDASKQDLLAFDISKIGFDLSLFPFPDNFPILPEALLLSWHHHH